MNIEEWKAEQRRLATEYAHAELEPEIVAFLTSWEPDAARAGTYAEWATKVEPILNKVHAELAKPEDKLDEQSIAAIQDRLTEVLAQLGVKPVKKRGVRFIAADQVNELARERVMFDRVARQVVWVASQELALDDAPVVRSSMSTDPDVDDKKNHEPLDDIDQLILRAADEGKDCWTADDWKAVVKFGQQKAKELAKEEANAAVKRLAHELFPELKADQRATANRLTKLFAKHGSGNIDDETKIKFVELTRAWKAAGGSLALESNPVRLVTVPNEQGQQRSFQVLESRKGRHVVATSTRLPEIQFVENEPVHP